ncbi:hypothetical protein SHIRM173S_04249 [Streptomyces hirsutus]
MAPVLNGPTDLTAGRDPRRAARTDGDRPRPRRATAAGAGTWALIKTLDKPDERRDFPGGHLSDMTGLGFAVAVFEPGWRWSESVGPIAGTPNSPDPPQRLRPPGPLAHPHGRRRRERRSAPATSSSTPGHDAWVVGEQQVVVYDFAGAMAQSYAKAADRPSDG